MDPIMNSQPIKVIDAKGFNSFKYPRIIHNGYLYYFGKKCTNHLQWKCYRVVSLKCPAVLRTTTDMSEIMYISVDHEHVHANDLVKIEALKNKINEHKQSSLSRRNACFILNDLDDVFEEINIPENPDYKNGSTEEYGKLTENTNSKDTIFNFENNLINKLEQKNNTNQIEINLEDGIKKNYTSYSFNEELKNVNQICRATLPNEHKMTINNNKNINKFSLRNNINKRNYILSKNTLVSSKKKKNMPIANKRTFKRSLTTNTNKRKNVKTTNNQKNKSTLIKNACTKTIPSKVKPRKYTSKLTNQNLPINKTTTTSTPVLKSISTTGSLSSIKVTYNMIESRLDKNIDNENENESISDGDDNDDDDDDDSIFGSDEANYNAVIGDNDDEENNIQLVQEDCMLHLNYNKKNWSKILKKMSDPLTGNKAFESILLNKILIQMMQGKNSTYRKILKFKRRSIDHWKKKYDRLQHELRTLVSIIRNDRNMRNTSVLNTKTKQFDYDTEHRNVDALSRVQVNDEAKIDGEDKEPTRPTRTRRPPIRLSEFYSY